MSDAYETKVVKKKVRGEGRSKNDERGEKGGRKC